MRRTDNHFISVSKQGVLIARRKGQPPVDVAGVEGVLILADDAARAQGCPAELRAHFAPGGAHRAIRVLEVTAAAERMPVERFQARFGVDDARLGRWLRAAVEAALDCAATKATMKDDDGR